MRNDEHCRWPIGQWHYRWPDGTEGRMAITEGRLVNGQPWGLTLDVGRGLWTLNFAPPPPLWDWQLWPPQGILPALPRGSVQHSKVGFLRPIFTLSLFSNTEGLNEKVFRTRCSTCALPRTPAGELSH